MYSCLFLLPFSLRLSLHWRQRRQIVCHTHLFRLLQAPELCSSIFLPQTALSFGTHLKVEPPTWTTHIFDQAANMPQNVNHSAKTGNRKVRHDFLLLLYSHLARQTLPRQLQRCVNYINIATILNKWHTRTPTRVSAHPHAYDDCVGLTFLIGLKSFQLFI